MLRTFLLAGLLLAMTIPAPAQAGSGVKGTFDPSVLKIDEDVYLGKFAPDIAFTDETGKAMHLRDVTDKPLILLLIYYDCPIMCPVLGEELSSGLDGVQDLVAGKDYNVLVLSFSEKDTSEKAQMFRRKLEGKKGEALNWVFATTTKEDIKAITNSVGYRFFETQAGMFTHPNVYVFLSPEKKITRYIFGAKSDPFSLRLAVLESAKGKIGKFKLSSLVTLACYRYDSDTGEYVLSLPALFGTGGVSMVLMTGVLAMVISRKKKKLLVNNEGGNR